MFNIFFKYSCSNCFAHSNTLKTNSYFVDTKRIFLTFKASTASPCQKVWVFCWCRLVWMKKMRGYYFSLLYWIYYILIHLIWVEQFILKVLILIWYSGVYFQTWSHSTSSMLLLPKLINIPLDFWITEFLNNLLDNSIHPYMDLLY